jgi:hypothetical protein
MSRRSGYSIVISLMVLPILAACPLSVTAQTVINFEGLGNLQPIGTISGAMFSSNWLSINSCTVGGSGNFVNFPSGTGIAFILVGGSGTVGTITFGQPVASVSMRYADRTSSLTLTAVDAAGNTVGVAVGPQTAVTVTGQCGVSDTWGTLSINAPSAPITSITIHDQGNFFAIDDLTFTVGCRVNVQRLSQGNPLWAANLYDHSSAYTIQEKGCALTSLSMALNTAGIAALPGGLANDPGGLNQFMTNTDTDYFGQSVYWGPATRDASGNTLKFHYSSINSVQDLQGATQYLDTVVCQGSPVIVGVNLDQQGTPGHYVVVTGKQGNDYTIADPGFARTMLSDYASQFVTRGFVADPSGDISELNLAVGDAAELLIVNSAEQKTGYDPSVGNVVQQIPNSVYLRDSLQDDRTGAPPTEIDHFGEIFQPTQGTYQVLVTGLKLGTYSLSERMFSKDGSAQPDVIVAGVAGPGSSSAFSIHVSSVPGSTPTAVRIATSQSTLTDISNSLALGLIDNHGIANALTSKISAASAAAAGGDKTTASNILNAFIHQVNAQTGKHITGVAIQVLLEDANSLMSQ